MEIKTIELIQSEVANILGYKSWGDLSVATANQRDRYNESFRMVVKRYASQFQTNTDLITTELCVLRERVAELEGMLGRCKNEFQQYRDVFGQSSSLESEIESLINKVK